MIYRYKEVYRPALAFSLDALGMIFTAEGALEFHNGMIAYPEGSGVYFKDSLWEPRFFAEIAVERDFYIGDWSLSLLGEYFFNGSGYTGDESDLFFSDLNSENPLESITALFIMTNADSFFLGRHYGLFSISIENPDYLSVSSMMIINFQDQSFTLDNTIKFLFLEDIDIYGRFTYIHGRQNRSEFGISPVNYLMETGISYHF